MKRSIRSNRLRRTIAVLALASCSVAFLAPSAIANPSNVDPSKPLAAHGTIDGAADLVQRLYGIHNSAESQLLKLLETNPTRLPVSKVESAVGNLWKAQRDAEHLKLMGESAGFDLEIKFRQLALQYKKLALTCRGTPQGGRLFLSRKSQLQRDAVKRDRFLSEQQAALQSGDVESVNTKMETFGLKHLTALALFSPTETVPFISKFNEVINSTDTRLKPARRKAYQAVAIAKIKDELSIVSAFATESARVRDEIAATGTAKLAGGKSGDAADAIAYLGSAWGSSSAALIRVAGLQMTFGGSGDASELIEPSVSEARKLAANASAAIAKVVDAAADKTPSDQVADLYSRALEQISLIDRRGDGKSVAAACQTALGKLASKSPGLADRVANYSRATDEVLVWRAAFTKQRASLLAKKFPPIYTLMNEEKPVTKTNKPKIFGSMSSRPRVVAAGSFSIPANWNVFEAANDLVGKSTSSVQVLRLSPSSGIGVVPFVSSHYANVNVGFRLEKEIADLRKALLVDDTHRPLSIAAADALSAAEMGDYEQVGGMISRLDLESLSSRLIGLPNVAYMLGNLGQIPQPIDSVPAVQQTCWRFNVTPRWVRHKYFVALVPTQTQ